MASTILKMASKLRNMSQETTSLGSLRRSLCTVTKTSTTTSRRKATKPNFTLLSKLSPIGNPSISIVPDLDNWAQDGSKYNATELRYVVKNLRSRRRFNHALQACEWLQKKDGSAFTSGDHAVQLDLIGKIRGVESAETYFNSTISGVGDKGKLYGALLYCYANEGMTDKCLSLMQKMKDLGIADTLAYNSIMILYKNTEQLNKIPEVLFEMKKDGIIPNNFSYKICLDAYGTKSDFDNLEKLLKEMESQSHIPAEWDIYANAANLYLKAGESEKALAHLKKCEKLVGNDVMGYRYLISHHASLGGKDEVMRLWKIQTEKRKHILNMDYITMISTLVKFGELEEAKEILEEWESSCRFYDFRVPNILLIGYCQKGLSEKAESVLLKIIAKGKTPVPNCWSIIAAGYLDENNMDKTFECMKKALAVQSESIGWMPKGRVFTALLDWIVDNRAVEEVEAFMDSVKDKRPADREVYQALIRTCIRLGKEVDGLLERMKSDGIDVDEDTQKILKAQAA